MHTPSPTSTPAREASLGAPAFVTLPGGRRLAWTEYGDPEGAPVLYFTGGQSSRLDGRQWHALARELGVRLVTCDRPGVGRSELDPARRLLDWPADVACLCEAAGIERFACFGLSGGGPHAAAVAHTLGDRVERLAIVSGAAPPSMPRAKRGLWFPVRILYALARWWPSMLRRALAGQANFIADRDTALKQMRRALPAPDVALIDARPEVMNTYLDAGLEGYREGIEGDAVEWSQIYARPWGFELGEITTPTRLWYGRADANAPVHIGRYLVTQLPNAELIEVEHGHFSTINTHIEDILTWLRPAREAG